MRLPAALSDIPSFPIIHVMVYPKTGVPRELEEHHPLTLEVQEIFHSFASLVKPFLPSWGDLVQSGAFGGMVEVLKGIEI